jgi:hypothetical protein
MGIHSPEGTISPEDDEAANRVLTALADRMPEGDGLTLIEAASELGILWERLRDMRELGILATYQLGLTLSNGANIRMILKGENNE